MAAVEKKVVTRTEYRLTLSEREAQLLMCILGDCVLWSDSVPELEEMFNGLEAAEVPPTPRPTIEYDELEGMFLVKVSP